MILNENYILKNALKNIKSNLDIFNSFIISEKLDKNAKIAYKDMLSRYQELIGKQMWFSKDSYEFEKIGIEILELDNDLRKIVNKLRDLKESLNEIKIDPYPIKGFLDKIDNYLHITKIGHYGFPFKATYEDHRIIIDVPLAAGKLQGIIEKLFKEANIKYDVRQYENEVDYFISDRYIDKQSLKKDLQEDISPKSFVAPLTIEYYQKLLNQSRLQPQSKTFVQRVINSVKKSGNLASASQLSILSKFKNGNIQ